ncbi:hypothetical protein, partial [Actinomyces sp. oral taxon 448]|uniref:hypothetical protein n=1 Tax=Actinomyces sp. oral taxon 448 TaxID=712124 RepID=UPI00155B3E28
MTAAGRLTTGRLTTVPSGVMPAAGVRMTRPGRFTAAGRLTSVPGVPTSAVTGAGVRMTAAGMPTSAVGTAGRLTAVLA